MVTPNTYQKQRSLYSSFLFSHMFRRLLSLVGYDLSIRRLTPFVTRYSHSRPFRQSRIVLHESGQYYHLEPMPSPYQLRDYYSVHYWQERGDQAVALKKRDLLHLNIILPRLKQISSNTSNITIVNFGSGHGGLSYLLHSLGYIVINIEPSDPPALVSSPSFLNYKSLQDFVSSQASHKISLFYSSHSLEHVPSVQTFLSAVRMFVDDETLFFFEVPDADAPGNGPMRNSVEPPHTYYFKKEFFLHNFREPIYLASYAPASHCEYINHPVIRDIPYRSSCDRGVIRFLGYGLL